MSEEQKPCPWPFLAAVAMLLGGVLVIVPAVLKQQALTDDYQEPERVGLSVTVACDADAFQAAQNSSHIYEALQMMQRESVVHLRFTSTPCPIVEPIVIPASAEAWLIEGAVIEMVEPMRYAIITGETQ